VQLVFSPSVLLASAVVYALGSSMIRRRPAVRRRSLVRFAGKVDLPLPDPSLWPRAEAALARRNLAVDLGVAVGVATAAVLAWVLGAPEGLSGDTGATGDGLWALIVAGAALAGAATGAAWAGARQARQDAPAPGPRVARPKASRATDYVAPLELWGARVMALAPAVALAIGLVIATAIGTVAPAELLNVGTVLAAIVGLTALAVGEVTERRLLDLPQTAGSSLELAWSDALRARVLRDVVTAPLAIGVYACFALVLAASAGVGDPTIANGLIGLIGLGMIALAVIAVVSVASRPQRHFRQRLWPRDGASFPSLGAAEPTGGSR
jgi:hypothetical protein